MAINTMDNSKTTKGMAMGYTHGNQEELIMANFEMDSGKEKQ